MKPAPFEYVRPRSLDEALSILAEHGDDASILAGGQSLVPMMNFRLARPALIVDLAAIPDLDQIDFDGGELRLGAMSRQAVVKGSPLTRARFPLLVEALRHVGHHQIRTRGTIGGSIAHADPAAELPAIAVATDARMHVASPTGTRTIAAADFFEGPYTTALAADEILTAVVLPVERISGWAFEEIARTSGDFAVAGVVAARLDTGLRLVGFGLGSAPQRLHAAESAVTGGSPTLTAEAISDAAAAAAIEVEPSSDDDADASYRRDAIATLVGRCLTRMAA